MVKKRGLGKPLDALLSYTSSDFETHANPFTESTKERLQELALDQLIKGKYQPRRDMDPAALENLAQSIQAQGVIQPLIVRPIGPNRYEIVAGERRFRAAKLAGLSTVPVIIRNIPDEAALAVALIENIQREDLNPIEEAVALNRLIDEFDMTHQQLAQSVGKSRASVTNLLRLLALPDPVKAMLEEGQLEMGHARTLITLPAAAQLETAQMIASRQLSVRETENLVRKLQSPAGLASAKSLDPDILHLQETLSKQLNLRVAIHCNRRGKGRLVIHYQNLLELDQLLLQLRSE